MSPTQSVQAVTSILLTTPDKGKRTRACDLAACLIFTALASSTALACVDKTVDCMDRECLSDSSGSEDFDTTEGDGDPGDGDGDSIAPCENNTPVVTCSDANVCWAAENDWTAEARAIEQSIIDNAVDSGIWTPVNIGIGTECWELIGSDNHTCVVSICGAKLFGQPANEIPLEPAGSACDFTGVWESTAFALEKCFGLIDGVAVELRDAATPYHVGEMWGPCPTINGIPTLCSSEDIACVPADFGESNICLPLNGCPSALPSIGVNFEVGWGSACYPRCEYDTDCLDGMVCGISLADNSQMCAWPR